MAQFRSYDSLGESFNDYADFLTSSPRYADVLKQGGNAEHYVEALQEAGYATDPAYAQKIKRIMDGDTLASMAEFNGISSGTAS
jgi:flagellar protein FlgJ